MGHPAHEHRVILCRRFEPRGKVRRDTDRAKPPLLQGRRPVGQDHNPRPDANPDVGCVRDPGPRFQQIERRLRRLERRILGRGRVAEIGHAPVPHHLLKGSAPARDDLARDPVDRLERLPQGLGIISLHKRSGSDDIVEEDGQLPAQLRPLLRRRCVGPFALAE